MDSKHHDALRRITCQACEQMRAAQEQQLRLRQAAAAFLRVARSTKDAAERKALKRKAVELLLPTPTQEPPAARAIAAGDQRSR